MILTKIIKIEFCSKCFPTAGHTERLNESPAECRWMPFCHQSRQAKNLKIVDFFFVSFNGFAFVWGRLRQAELFCDALLAARRVAILIINY